MSVDEGLVAWIQEALEPLGTVTKRPMMGGATLYMDGTVFAIIGSDGGLWFKADAERTLYGMRPDAGASPRTWPAGWRR